MADKLGSGQGNDEELQFDSFSDATFLRETGLEERSALDYFYLSKFFDTNSVNQKRRRGIEVSSDTDGVEYRLVHVNAAGRKALPIPIDTPHNYPVAFGVYVISRVRRTNRLETPERVYYTAAGTIFQAPSLGALVMHRLYSCCRELNKGIDKLEKMLCWSVLSGYHWKADLDIAQTLRDIRGNEETVEEIAESRSRLTVPASVMQDGSTTEDDHIISLDGVLPPTRVLSHKRIIPTAKTGISVLYRPRETAHATEVVNKEYLSLYHASERLRAMFEREREGRAKKDYGRFAVSKEIFDRLEQLQDRLQTKVDLPSVQTLASMPLRFDNWNIQKPLVA